MSMLNRYKKKGGFAQLLTLIETSPPGKRAKLLEIIASEDAEWAEAIRLKMIDMNRIYSWNDDVLEKIIGTLQDLILAVAIQGAPQDFRTRVFALISHGRASKLNDILQTRTSSTEEIAAMQAKVIVAVRTLADNGDLRFKNFDPDLEIREGIEKTISSAA
jgi:flagellar motor switch protein FliG